MGHGIVLAYIAIGWLCSLLFLILLKRENAKREAGLRDEVIRGEENPKANEDAHAKRLLVRGRGRGIPGFL